MAVKLKGENMKKILYFIIASFITFAGFETHAEEWDITYYRKVLVVYFSATGNTAEVARKIADGIHADSYEIIPKKQYTEADLNWHDDNSRSMLEIKDETSRPEIDGKVENIEQYNIIFVGFPIWGGKEPAIIDTFIESYDFSGKKIIPFATSGSSDIGDSGKNIQKLAPNAKVAAGMRFSADATEEELKEWAEPWI